MRHLVLFGTTALASALAACGGSSSETPPPLQPDPAGFRYAPASSRSVVDEGDAGDAPRTNADSALDPSANPPAPARAPSSPSPAAR